MESTAEYEITDMFDAMESVAKEKYQMLNSTFGQVVNRISSIGMRIPLKPISIPFSSRSVFRNRSDQSSERSDAG
jgi:hypothetical protein